MRVSDLDAIPMGMEFEEINKLVKQVAQDLQLPGDWLNPYYYSFAHVLSPRYGERLINVFQGKLLTVLALGKEDLLIMKCFAHRAKDVGHIKSLIKAGTDLDFVENHIKSLIKKGIKGAQESQSQLAINTRNLILKNLIKEKSRFSASEYREACDSLISIRQAQRDLAQCKQLVSRGRTRGKICISKPCATSACG